MSTQTLSPGTLRKLGLEALAKSLGPIGMARFLQQFETGVGELYQGKSAMAKRYGR